ncbi:MAG TPA: CAP domain-containing protein [Anaerolineales bacterium]|nr:CAP domain-containing protein [Anaerolineales bacterium]
MRSRQGQAADRRRAPARAHRSTLLPTFRETALVGLILTPVVCALAIVPLAVLGEAALGHGLSPIGWSAVERMAVDLGLVSQPTKAAVAFLATDNRPFSAATGAPALTPPTLTRTPTASSTAIPLATNTPTATPSMTASATLTVTPTHTPTPSPSPTATRTRTPTRIPTRTRTASPPPATASQTTPATATQEGAATATAPAIPSETPRAPAPTIPPACDATGNAAFESGLLALINQERQSQGLQAYNLQSQLQAAAREHSADMACNDYLSHTGSDGSTAGDRARRQGYDWSWVGENIYATGNTSSSAPQQAFDWWMNSAPHRANLLHPNYTDIGLGYFYSSASSYGGYFTAVFARP